MFLNNLLNPTLVRTQRLLLLLQRLAPFRGQHIQRQALAFHQGALLHKDQRILGEDFRYGQPIIQRGGGDAGKLTEVAKSIGCAVLAVLSQLVSRDTAALAPTGLDQSLQALGDAEAARQHVLARFTQEIQNSVKGVTRAHKIDAARMLYADARARLDAQAEHRLATVRTNLNQQDLAYEVAQEVAWLLFALPAHTVQIFERLLANKVALLVILIQDTQNLRRLRFSGLAKPCIGQLAGSHDAQRWHLGNGLPEFRQHTRCELAILANAHGERGQGLHLLRLLALFAACTLRRERRAIFGQHNLSFDQQAAQGLPGLRVAMHQRDLARLQGSRV